MSHTTRLTKIGNSFGIILSKKLLKEASISETQEISIEIKKGTIMLTPVKKALNLNLDVSTWDAQFRKAKKENKKRNLKDEAAWPDHMSEEADKEWTWPENL